MVKDTDDDNRKKLSVDNLTPPLTELPDNKVADNSTDNPMDNVETESEENETFVNWSENDCKISRDVN